MSCNTCNEPQIAERCNSTLNSSQIGELAYISGLTESLCKKVQPLSEVLAGIDFDLVVDLCDLLGDVTATGAPAVPTTTKLLGDDCQWHTIPAYPVIPPPFDLCANLNVLAAGGTATGTTQLVGKDCRTYTLPAPPPAFDLCANLGTLTDGGFAATGFGGTYLVGADCRKYRLPASFFDLCIALNGLADKGIATMPSNTVGAPAATELIGKDCGTYTLPFPADVVCAAFQDILGNGDLPYDGSVSVLGSDCRVYTVKPPATTFDLCAEIAALTTATDPPDATTTFVGGDCLVYNLPAPYDLCVGLNALTLGTPVVLGTTELVGKDCRTHILPAAEDIFCQGLATLGSNGTAPATMEFVGSDCQLYTLPAAAGFDPCTANAVMGDIADPVNAAQLAAYGYFTVVVDVADNCLKRHIPRNAVRANNATLLAVDYANSISSFIGGAGLNTTVVSVAPSLATNYLPGYQVTFDLNLCEAGALALASTAEPLTARVLGVSAAGCVTPLAITAEAVTFGAEDASGRLQEDPLNFTYDPTNNFLRIGQNNLGNATDAAAIGVANQTDAPRSSILGGELNTIEAAAVSSSIVGGLDNLVQSNSGVGLNFVGGGTNNTVRRHRASIVGGEANLLETGFSLIGGGFTNSVLATGSNGWEVLVGGRENTIAGGQLGFLGGGFSNDLAGIGSVLVGGLRNQVNGTASVIAGGEDNLETVPAGEGNNVISGGSRNQIVGTMTENVIGGGDDNTITQLGSFGVYQGVIGGGQTNRIRSAAASLARLDAPTIAGGQNNTIELLVPTALADGYSTIGGGINNVVTGIQATIPGGTGLDARGYRQTVVGAYNLPRGTNSTFTQNDFAFLVGTGSDNATRDNGLGVYWDNSIQLALNKQVGAQASNAAAVTALNAAIPPATYPGRMTTVQVGATTGLFFSDGVTWRVI